MIIIIIMLRFLFLFGALAAPMHTFFAAAATSAEARPAPKSGAFLRPWSPLLRAATSEAAAGHARRAEHEHPSVMTRPHLTTDHEKFVSAHAKVKTPVVKEEEAGSSEHPLGICRYLKEKVYFSSKINFMRTHLPNFMKQLPLRPLAQHSWWSANEHTGVIKLEARRKHHGMLPHSRKGKRNPVEEDEEAQQAARVQTNLYEPEYFCFHDPCDAKNSTSVRLEDSFTIAASLASSSSHPKLTARKTGGLGVEGNLDDTARWRLVLNAKEKTVRIQNRRFEDRFLAVGDRCVDQETKEEDAGTLSPDPSDTVWKISKAPQKDAGAKEQLYLLKQVGRNQYLAMSRGDEELSLSTLPTAKAGALWALSPEPPAEALAKA